MPQKRDSYEEDEEENPKLSFDKLTFSLGILSVAISELFLYLLGTKTTANFGLLEIIFGLISGIVITLFLMWVRFILTNNKYMGVFIFMAGIASVSYALTRKFQGVYTTIFLSIGIIVSLAYVLYYFIKLGKK